MSPRTFKAFKRSGRITGDHEAMLAEIEALYARERCLRPESVLEQARPDASALHDHFEWDDELAAHQWRIEQAGHLIRCTVLVTEDDTERREVRAFVSVTTEDEGGEACRVYIRTEDLDSEPALARQVLESIMRDAHAFLRKYEAVKEIACIRSAVEDFRRTYIQPAPERIPA